MILVINVFLLIKFKSFFRILIFELAFPLKGYLKRKYYDKGTYDVLIVSTCSTTIVKRVEIKAIKMESMQH